MAAQDVQRAVAMLPGCTHTVFEGVDTQFIRSGQTSTFRRCASLCRNEEGVPESDTALAPMSLEHPEWIPAFDIEPERAADSRRRIFNWAEDEKMLVFGFHFPPFPGLGHVVVEGQGWRWLPIV